MHSASFNSVIASIMNIVKIMVAVIILLLFPIFHKLYSCDCKRHGILPSPKFPVSLNSDCFIYMVFLGQNSSAIDIESSLMSWIGGEMSFASQKHLYTWTTYSDLNQLNFGISKNELMDDEEKILTIYQRYFRFFDRYQTGQCKLAIILSESFNATLYAVNGIGYGTSDRVLYLVGVDMYDQESDEILQGFSQDLPTELDLELDIDPFHAPLAFFTFSSDQDEKGYNENADIYSVSILVYCYFCSVDQIGKFHPISPLLVENLPTFSQVKDDWNRWNSHGYGNKIVLHSPGNWEYKDVTRINCTRQDRKMYRKINRCHYAEMLVYNNLDNVLNMTYTEFRDLFRDQATDGDDWYLNINTDEWSLGKVVVNVYASTRGTYQIFQEVGYKFIYCNPSSKMQSLAWDIFLHVIDSGTWFGLLGVIAAYAILTRKLFYSLDIIWPFFGMSTWQNHPRLIMGFYLIAIGFFLQSSYSSGTSSDFIQLMSPMSAPTLFKTGYKTWVPGVSDSPMYVRLIYYRAPAFLRKKVHELIGGESIEDILYKPTEKGYSMPTRPLEMIRDMVKRHLLVMSVGLPRYNSLMQIFGITNWALIQDDKERYLCAGVDSPSHIRIPDRRHASRTWGYLAGKAAGIVKRWFEMGFVKRMQTLLNYKLVLDRPINWIDAGKVSEQLPVKVNSPLGVTCLCLVVLNLVNLVCFFGHLAFLKRNEIRTRVKRLIYPQYYWQTEWLP